MCKLLPWIVVVGWALGSASLLPAQDSCVDCHSAQLREGEITHLEEWRDSPHARAGVGCADCHGGEDGTYVQMRAHRGVHHSASKKASTHRSNLPATCGKCHGDLLTALQQSHHWKMFESGDKTAPTCYTCHEALAVKTLGAGGLSARCSLCHAPEAAHPRPESLTRGAEVVRRVRALTDQRTKARRLVLRVPDEAVRHDAGDAYFEASQALDDGIEAGHAFDYDSSEPALDLAERLFAELIAGLEHPQEH